MSQFTSPGELAKALIKARDAALSGEVPVVFFDEFDTALAGEQLGWLRYFLSVMQDGVFQHDGHELRIGRAILAFAGGTSSSYDEFTRKHAPPKEKDQFKLAKGPDFVSRLRGFVDIIGPDRRLIGPDRKPDETDNVFIIRRAITIRSLLKTRYRDLLGNNADPLDRGVAEALLSYPRYEHGFRSLEAVLEMSSLAKARRFEKSMVPPEDQLAMHLAKNERGHKEFFEIMKKVRSQ